MDTEPVEMTKNQFIERALGMFGLLADYVPRHTVQGDNMLHLIHVLQNARFTD